MGKIANQRIRAGGKSFLAGDQIDVDDAALEGLPAAAIREAVDEDTAPTEPSAPAEPPAPPAPTGGDAEDLATRLRTHLKTFAGDAFKRDGDLRARTRRDLVEALGEDPGDNAIGDALTEIRAETAA